MENQEHIEIEHTTQKNDIIENKDIPQLPMFIGRDFSKIPYFYNNNSSNSSTSSSSSSDEEEIIATKENIIITDDISNPCYTKLRKRLKQPLNKGKTQDDFSIGKSCSRNKMRNNKKKNKSYSDLINDFFTWCYLIYFYTKTVPFKLIDKIWCTIWYSGLIFLQYIILRYSSEKTRTERKYAHLFKFPSQEEVNKPICIGKREYKYINVVENFRRKFLRSENQRMKIYKTIIGFIFAFIIIIVFVSFVIRGQNSMKMEMEFKKHVKTEEVINEEFTITNVMHTFDTIDFSFTDKQQWLLYKQPKKARITSDNLLIGYTQVQTKGYSKVNISIDNLISQMKRDSIINGLNLSQPCICASHYGIPINIILTRDHLMYERMNIHEKNSINIRPQDVPKDIVYIDPKITSTIYDSVKGSLSIDSLVVPKRMRNFWVHTLINGHDENGNDIKKEKYENEHDALIMDVFKNISPLDTIVDLYRSDGDKKILKDVLSMYEFHDSSFLYITDLTTRDGKQTINSWITRRNSVPTKSARNLNIGNDPNGNKINGEISIAYSDIIVRDLMPDGSQSIAKRIKEPYSICFQRCIRSVRGLSYE